MSEQKHRASSIRRVRGLSRRSALGMFGLGAAALLAACATTPTPTTAPKPTTAPAAAPTAAAAAPPTPAPAAAPKPTAAATTAPAPAATTAPTAAPAAQPTTAAAAVAVPKPGSGTLTFGYGQKTSFSHFMHMRDYAGGENIYSRRFANAKLVSLNKGRTAYEPDLAEKYEFSADGRKLTFNLRKGLKWHDGQPFTARDVEFTFTMHSLPGLGPYNRGNQFKGFIVGQAELIDGKASKLESVRVVDDYTITFDLEKPVNADLLFDQLNDVAIAPRHLLERYLNRDKAKDILTDPWATTKAHVGLGPFKVVDYVADQYIVYEPFDGYYRGKPKLNRLIYRPFADRQTLAASIEKKETDVGWIPDSEYERMQKLDFLGFVLGKGATIFSGTPFNTRRPYLKDKRVRQALMHAIDRETMLKQVYKNTTEIIDSPVEAPKFGVSPNIKKYTYDPEKAKQLLKDAGWDPNRKLRWAVQAAPADETIYATINGYWSKVGVQAEYQVYGQNDKQFQAPDWDFDMYLSGYHLNNPKKVAETTDARNCTSACVGLSHPRMEQLFDQYVERRSDDEYKKIVHELQDIISDEALYLTLVRTANVWAVNKRVQGLEPVYFALNDWNLEKVTVSD